MKKLIAYMISALVLCNCFGQTGEMPGAARKQVVQLLETSSLKESQGIILIETKTGKKASFIKDNTLDLSQTGSAGDMGTKAFISEADDITRITVITADGTFTKEMTETKTAVTYAGIQTPVLYPNPAVADQILRLPAALKFPLIVEIRDLQGKLLSKKTASTRVASLQMEYPAAGAYMVHITDNSGNTTLLKAIKQ